MQQVVPLFHDVQGQVSSSTTSYGFPDVWFKQVAELCMYTWPGERLAFLHVAGQVLGHGRGDLDERRGSS